MSRLAVGFPGTDHLSGGLNGFQEIFEPHVVVVWLGLVFVAHSTGKLLEREDESIVRGRVRFEVVKIQNGIPPSNFFSGNKKLVKPRL